MDECSLFEGRCQCEALRYRVSGTALTCFVCHCRDCQRQSASAFGMALWVEATSVDILCGQLQDWTRTTPSGRTMTCQFCARCGTRVFHRLADQPRIVSIKPGTLDHTEGLRPSGHLWTRSAQSWIDLATCGGLAYEGNPDGFAALMEAWQSRRSTHDAG